MNSAACMKCKYFCLSYKLLYSNVELIVTLAYIPKTVVNIWRLSTCASFVHFIQHKGPKGLLKVATLKDSQY